MAKGRFHVDAVLGAARVLFLSSAADVACFLQFVQNALHRRVRATHVLSNILDPGLRVLSQADQHVCVICQKRPRSQLGGTKSLAVHTVVVHTVITARRNRAAMKSSLRSTVNAHFVIPSWQTFRSAIILFKPQTLVTVW